MVAAVEKPSDFHEDIIYAGNGPFKVIPLIVITTI